MNISEFIFLLQFFAYIGIFLVTLYNILSVGKFYDLKMVWILFVGQLITYLVGMSVTMTLDVASYATSELVAVLYQLQVFMFEAYFVMLVVQLFFYWKATTNQPTQARKSAELKSRQGGG